jgi:hypothetical protein
MDHEEARHQETGPGTYITCTENKINLNTDPIVFKINISEGD